MSESAVPTDHRNVMAARIEPRDSLDDFPTPPWATRALCERLEQFSLLSHQDVWEPACGRGHMSRPLEEYFGQVMASDIHDYGFGGVGDFLQPGDFSVDWIITNPPFRLAEQFVETALGRARIGVAMFVRTAFLESVGRHANLFSRHRPWAVMQFTERVPLHKGRLVEKGSTATAYCWIVWMKTNPAVTRFEWIAPCRRRLERPGDYEQAAA